MTTVSAQLLHWFFSRAISTATVRSIYAERQCRCVQSKNRLFLLFRTSIKNNCRHFAEYRVEQRGVYTYWPTFVDRVVCNVFIFVVYFACKWVRILARVARTVISITIIVIVTIPPKWRQIFKREGKKTSLQSKSFDIFFFSLRDDDKVSDRSTQKPNELKAKLNAKRQWT